VCCRLCSQSPSEISVRKISLRLLKAGRTLLTGAALPNQSTWCRSMRSEGDALIATPVQALYMLHLTNCFLFAHPNNISCRLYSYMSTVVPADVPCCVKQCHHYTPDGYSQHQDCITSVYFQSYPVPLGKYKKNLFHISSLQSSRFMYNKKEGSVVLLLSLVLLILLLMLVLLIPLLPQPQPPKKNNYYFHY
jgi:hypothetical protein